MKFCKICENMLDVNTEGTPSFKCRKCDYSEPITPDNPIVYERVLKQDMAGQLVLNPYLTQDPTLPRFVTIVCPNGHSGDVVGVKKNVENVIWMYQCGECKVSWEQVSRRS